MKYIIYIVTLLLCSNALIGQEVDYNSWDDPTSINWDDPVYNDFFTLSCPVVKKKSAEATRSITKWYASDPQWKDSTYGAKGGNCGIFKNAGCYLTCIAMMLTNSGDYINPWDLDKFAFIDHKYYASLCGVSEDAINKRPAPTIFANGRFRVPNPIRETVYDTIKLMLNGNGFVVAKVNFKDYAGTDYGCAHWILIYGWENVDGADVFYTADPNKSDDDKKGKLSDYKPCEVRYFKLLGNKQAKTEANGNSAKVIKTKKNVVVGFSWSLPHKKSAGSTCEKTLWVIRDSNGKIIDTSKNADSYSFSQSVAGTYTVSFAVNNENGFDGERILVVVEEGTPITPPVINPPNPGDPCIYLPHCGDGICNYGCELEHCTGDCGGQYIDYGFRVNGSVADDIVYLCKPSLKITPKKSLIVYGKRIRPRMCTALFIVTLIYVDCDTYFKNYYVNVKKCDINRNELENVYSITVDEEYDEALDPNPSFGSIDVAYSFAPNQLYKIEVSTYNGDDFKGAGWKSSYRYVYLLPSQNYVFDATFSNTYLQNNITVQNQSNFFNKMYVDRKILAKNSIEILPSSDFGDDFEASIDPSLPINCSSTKSAEIDTFQHTYVSPNSIPDNVKTNSDIVSDIIVFPNPNNGIFTVALQNEVVDKILVTNSSGQLMQIINVNGSTNCSVNVDLAKYTKGMYLLNFRSKQKSFTKKVVIE